jgi:hypothetical protein
MAVFPALSDQDDKVDAIEREMRRVFDSATREVALAREQIRRAEDTLSDLERARWLQRLRSSKP